MKTFLIMIIGMLSAGFGYSLVGIMSVESLTNQILCVVLALSLALDVNILLILASKTKNQFRLFV